MEVKYPQVKVKLVGEDGNIFFIMGRVTQAMRRAGLGQEIQKQFIKEVTSSHNYDNALQVVMKWVETE